MSIKVSFTAMEKYKLSPRAWYLHYQLKLRPEVIGSALVFGNAIDAGLNTLLRNKKENKTDNAFDVFELTLTKQVVNNDEEDLRTSKKIKYSQSDFDSDILTSDDYELINSSGYIAEWVSLRRKGFMILEAYEKQVIPHLSEIIAIQQFIQIENETKDRIIGYTDFIAKFQLDETIPYCDLELKKYNGHLIVLDNKTSSIKYKEDSVKNSKQLGTYFEDPKLAKEVNYCGYIVIPKKIRKQKEPLIPIEFIIDKVDASVISSVFEDYSNTIHGIKMGYFPCSGECSDRSKNFFGCPYMKFCASHGQDTEGLIYVREKDENGKTKKS